jgi:hypothetical protein
MDALATCRRRASCWEPPLSLAAPGSEEERDRLEIGMQAGSIGRTLPRRPDGTGPERSRVQAAASVVGV